MKAKKNPETMIAATSITRYHFLAAPILFLVISITWFLLTDYTWDDDAITRYWNTEVAGTDPVFFINSWNRPLFVLLFYFPVLLFGKAGVAIGMSLLTASSSLFLYYAMKRWQVVNPFMVIVFLLFQTFLFGISRDAMTEPLASFFICWGIYCYAARKYVWMALIGSLLPLARPETVLLLPFWAIPFLKEKKIRYLPLLGVGLLLWWAAWFIYKGNPMAFIDELTASGEKVNRYGRTSEWHHLSKYIYVTGPVVFFFLFIGLLSRLLKKKIDYFIILQFLAGFLVYVVFSSYLDLGQSGGALRNLITLAPFCAIISLYGFNYWYNVTRLGNTRKEKNIIPRTLLIIYIVFLLLIAASQFTNELVMRQFYNEDEKDYRLLILLLIISLLVITGFNIRTKRIFYSYCLFFSLLQAGFTLWFENPSSHGGTERPGISRVYQVLKATGMLEGKIYCNHPWFYWTSGRNIRDTVHCGRVDSASLRDMSPGEILIWDGHYTSANYTNIDFDRVNNDTSFIPIYYVERENGQLLSMVFVRSSYAKANGFFQRFRQQLPLDSRELYLQGSFKRNKDKNFQEAISCQTLSLGIDPEFGLAYYERGLCYYFINDKEKACPDFASAASFGVAVAPSLGPYCGTRR